MKPSKMGVTARKVRFFEKLCGSGGRLHVLIPKDENLSHMFNSPYIMEAPELLDYDFVRMYLKLTIETLSDKEIDQIGDMIELERLRRESEGLKK